MGLFQSLKERLQKNNEPEAPPPAPPAAIETPPEELILALFSEQTAPDGDAPLQEAAPPVAEAPEPPPAPAETTARAVAAPLAFLGEKYPAEVEEKRNEYSDLLTLIQKNCNRLRAEASYSSPLGDETLALCEQAIALRRGLAPSLAEYDWVRHSNDPYKRIAVICEKRGAYLQAAQISLRALQDGLPNDGNAKGFAGRLDRMLKRGQLKPTEEMKPYLVKSKS